MPEIIAPALGTGSGILAWLQVVTGMPAAEPQVARYGTGEALAGSSVVQAAMARAISGMGSIAIDAPTYPVTRLARRIVGVAESTYHQRVGIATGCCRER